MFNSSNVAEHPPRRATTTLAPTVEPTTSTTAERATEATSAVRITTVRAAERAVPEQAAPEAHPEATTATVPQDEAEDKPQPDNHNEGDLTLEVAFFVVSSSGINQ